MRLRPLLVLSLCLRVLAAEPTVEVLPNGLTLVVEERHAAPVVVVNFWVRQGSKNEDAKDSGVSHYLEHMFYRGTATRASLQNREEILAVGGKTSAATWYDWTNYYNIVPSEDFVLALDGLADAFQHLTLDPKQMENEHSVVSEEIRQRIDDPGTFVYEEMMASAFNGHPYARRVVGPIEIVMAFDHDTLARYYARYTPSNLVVAIVGDVATDLALSEVKKRLGEGKPSEPLKGPPMDTMFHAGGRRTIERAGLGQSYLAAGFRIPGYRHPDNPTLQVAARILYGRLQSRLVEAEHTANEVSAHAFILGDQGLLGITARPIRVEDVSLLERCCLEEVRRFRDEGVTETEVEGMVRYFRLQDLFEGETNFQRAQDLGQALLNGDVRYATEWSERLSQVTRKDVERVAKLYLAAENYTSVSLLPEGTEAKLPAKEDERIASVLQLLAVNSDHPKGLAFADTMYPRVPEPSAGTHGGAQGGMPQPTESGLENGLRVLAATRPDSRTVEVGVFLRAGSALDPAGASGCAALATRWLQEGGKQYDRTALLTGLNRVGGQWGFTVEPDWLQVRLTVAPADVKDGLSILSDAITQPRLADDAFTKVRASLVASIREEDDTLGTVAFKHFYEHVFAGHPYAQPRAGRVDEVAALDAERVRGWIRAYVRPERTVLVCVSGREPKEMASWAETHFAAWKAQGDARAEPPAQPKPEPGEYASHMEKEQSYGVIGVLLPAAGDKQRAACTVLGDLLRLRVFKDLVYEQALAYSASSWIDWMRDASYLSVSCSTSPQKFDRAVAAARKHLDRVVAEGITDEECAQVKKRVLGARTLYEEGASGLVETWGRYEMLGLGWRAEKAAREAIERVTADEVASAAKALLAEDKRITVRVTPSSK